MPAFADGGQHSGGWRLVGEEGPELAFTGPERIFSHRDSVRMMSAGEDELIEELRGLRDEVRGLRAVTANGTKRTAEGVEQVAANTAATARVAALQEARVR